MSLLQMSSEIRATFHTKLKWYWDVIVTLLVTWTECPELRNLVHLSCFWQNKASWCLVVSELDGCTDADDGTGSVLDQEEPAVKTRSWTQNEWHFSFNRRLPKRKHAVYRTVQRDSSIYSIRNILRNPISSFLYNYLGIAFDFISEIHNRFVLVLLISMAFSFIGRRFLECI